MSYLQLFHMLIWTLHQFTVHVYFGSYLYFVIICSNVILICWSTGGWAFFASSPGFYTGLRKRRRWYYMILDEAQHIKILGKSFMGFHGISSRYVWRYGWFVVDKYLGWLVAKCCEERNCSTWVIGDYDGLWTTPHEWVWDGTLRCV